MGTRDVSAGAAPRFGLRAAAGERLGGVIYGTIVTLSVVVAGGRAYPGDAGHVAELVLVTVVVFWAAHVYAHALGDSVAHDRPLRAESLRRVARHELSIVESAVPPVAALLLGALGALAPGTALWLAFALGLAVLLAAGLYYARIERLGVAATLLVVAANVGLGLVLVALKLSLSH